MIIEKPETEDAPPAYDAILPHRPVTIDSKSPFPTSPSTSSSSGRQSAGGTRTKSWVEFITGPPTSTRQVRLTVLALVRDLVCNNPTSSSTSASESILMSCAEACKTHGLSFSDILQEKSIEGHTPLYWAIITLPRTNPNSNPSTPVAAATPSFDIISAILAHTTSITPSTLSDARLACLLASDQPLFAWLRSTIPAFAQLSGTDAVLLGVDAQGTPDEVEVELSGEGAFVARIRIGMFHRRMRVSGEVRIEFIACARIWVLRLFTHHTGAWALGLELMKHSPPTHVDGRFVVEVPSPSTPNRKPLAVPIRTRDARLHPVPHMHEDAARTVLDERSGAEGLMYENTPYVASDGTLRARLEVRLAKAGSDECVIV